MKNITISAISLLLILIFAACSSEKIMPVSADTAKSTALADAGFSEDEVIMLSQKLKNDDGVYIYNIVFVHDSTVYDYKIKLKAGKIARLHSEPYDLSSYRNYDLSLDAAKLIALTYAGVRDYDASFKVAKEDTESDQKTYRVIFDSAGTQYKFEINRYSGEIIEYEKEPS